MVGRPYDGHLQVFQRNYYYIWRMLNVRDGLIPLLFTAGVLSVPEKRRVESSDDTNTTLLDLLLTKPDRLLAFVGALRQSNQNHLADILSRPAGGKLEAVSAELIGCRIDW